MRVRSRASEHRFVASRAPIAHHSTRYRRAAAVPVAGGAARYLSLNPAATPQQVRGTVALIARYLRAIAESVGGLKLHIRLCVAESTHRCTLVHRGFDFGRKADVLDVKFGHLESVAAEIFIDLAADRVADLLVLSGQIEGRDL